MTPSWPVVAVRSIAAPVRNALVGGPFGSNLISADYVESGVPVIRGQNMVGRWVAGDFAFVSSSKAEALVANLAYPGDLLFTQRGTLGQVSLVPAAPYERYVISQSQMKVTVNREIADPLYYYYVFSTAEQKEHIRQHAIQTGVPHTNLGILRDTTVPIPPVTEQRAIARVLGTLDDKVELNRAMTETIEAMALALFDSWFVRFDPVRAKLEGRDPGLPKQISDLFPDRFVESDLGDIPAGWVATRWDDLVSLEYGRSLRNYGAVSGRYPVFGTNGRIGTCDVALCPHPGIVIGRKGAYRGVHFSPTPFYVIDTGFYVEPRSAIELRWAYYEMRRQDLNEMDSGSAIPSTSRDEFYAIKVVAPPTQVQVAFTQALTAGWSLQERLADESQTLGVIRDTLLPRLVSGALRLAHDERTLEAAPI
jgi:type I restriction enzyme, S subunit